MNNQKTDLNSSKQSFRPGPPRCKTDHHEVGGIFYREGETASSVLAAGQTGPDFTKSGETAVGSKGTIRSDLAGAKARAGDRHLTQGSCEAGLGTEGKPQTPGWDEHFGGTSWWSEGLSHLPTAASIIKTNWSLSAVSMQFPG